MKKNKAVDEKKSTQNESERKEILNSVNQKTGKQLRITIDNGSLSEFDELRSLIGQNFDNPDEKYNLYYKGIRRVLMSYLPKGKEFLDVRQLIYDEKNVFLNRGKKKSDNEGIRLSDGRMTYQEKMNDILNIILKWVSESQNPVDLYFALYELNEKNGYGHEVYDDTSIKFQKAFQKEKGN